MRLQDAVDSVGDALGLGAAEAQLYVHLCLAGPAKAGDLASALKLHRNEVYRSANRLLQRGLLDMTMERPARYAAIPPKVAFEGEIAARLASVERLRTVRDTVTPVLAQLEVQTTEATRNTYKVVQGRHEIFTARNRLIEDAERSVDWASSFAPSVSLASMSGGLDALASIVQRGVAVRALLKAPAPAWQKLRAFSACPTAQLRELEVDATLSFFVVDGHELLMWVVNDESESLHAKDEVAIQTTAPGFVQAEQLFFDQTWGRAKPAKLP